MAPSSNAWRESEERMKSIELFEKRNNEKLRQELEDLENQRRMLRQGIGQGIVNSSSYKLGKDESNKNTTSTMVSNVKLKGGFLSIKGKSQLDSNS